MSDRPCRLAGWVVTDRVSGAAWAADCDTGVCARCGITRCKTRARLITWQQANKGRSRFITFTVAPEDWQQRRAAIRDLRRRIVAKGYVNEWIWTTEAGEQTGMIHVHAIQWGDYIPHAELWRMWGDRRVEIKQARVTHGAYISKSAGSLAHYVSKGAGSDLDAALALNGGRLHHWSRMFFDGPIRPALARMRGTTERDCVLRFDPELRSQIDNGLRFGPLPVGQTVTEGR